MPLTAADLSDIRRFCGYPVMGAIQDLGGQAATTTLSIVLATLSDIDIATVQSELTDLRQLRSDITAMRDSVDTKKAAVWERNPLEMAERASLYLIKRRELCSFLGVPPGPAIFVEGVSDGGAVYQSAVAIV